MNLAGRKLSNMNNWYTVLLASTSIIHFITLFAQFRSFGELLDQPDDKENAPLHLAQEKGMYSKVKVLLEFRAG